LERGGGFGQNASNKIQKNETVVCSSVRKRVTILFKKTDLNIDNFFLLKKLWAFGSLSLVYRLNNSKNRPNLEFKRYS